MMTMLTDAGPATAAAVSVSTLLKGEIEVPAEQVVRFVSPLFGFDRHTTFAIYQTRPGPLYWLQSTEDVKVSFCILAPFAAGLDPAMDIGPADATDIGARSERDIDVYTTVVLDDDPNRIRTNLRAPILVCRRTGLAKQIILNDARLPVRFHLADLRQARAHRIGR